MDKHTAAIEGFFSSPAGGCVTSAPINITGSRNIGGLIYIYSIKKWVWLVRLHPYLIFGTIILLIPPNLTFILRQRFDSV